MVSLKTENFNDSKNCQSLKFNESHVHTINLAKKFTHYY